MLSAPFKRTYWRKIYVVCVFFDRILTQVYIFERCCYAEKFGTNLTSNGVAASLQFNAELTEDIVKISENNYNIQSRDVVRQHKRDYLRGNALIKKTRGASHRGILLWCIHIEISFSSSFLSDRFTPEKITQGYPKKLFQHALNNNRHTWFVGAYASYEHLGLITDYIEVLLEKTGVKEKHVGQVIDLSRFGNWEEDSN